MKLARYDLAAGAWTFARYALDAVSAVSGAWEGLFEVTLLPNGKFAIIERDNQLGAQPREQRRVQSAHRKVFQGAPQEVVRIGIAACSPK